MSLSIEVKFFKGKSFHTNLFLVYLLVLSVLIMEIKEIFLTRDHLQDIPHGRRGIGECRDERCPTLADDSSIYPGYSHPDGRASCPPTRQRKSAVGFFMPRIVDVGNHITLSFSTPVLARVFPNHEQVNEDNIVSIILDGENAWEHYPENAYYFLSGLYQKLSQHPDIELTTYTAYLNSVLDKVINYINEGNNYQVTGSEVELLNY